MNERLKELSNQAGFQLDELADDVFIPLDTLAELIVNECAKQLDVYKMMKLDPSFYSSMLRKHFGVNR